jgi:hypothetical protein
MPGREEKRLLAANFPVADADLVTSVARQRGEGIASFVRNAVYEKLARLSLLDEEQEKALGLPGAGR